MENNLGARLKELMTANKLNQQQLAQRLNCSPAFVSDTIRGIKKPGADFLAKASTTFNISLDWLVCGIGEPPINGTHDANIKSDLFKATSKRLLLALEASKGNIAAKNIIKSQLYKEDYILDRAELEALNLRINVKMRELEFLLSIYNSKLPHESFDDFCNRALSEAALHFDSLTTDPLIALINSEDSTS